MQRNSFFSKNSALNVELNEEDKLTLGAIERLIDSNDNDNVNYLSNGLIKYPVDLLQKLYNDTASSKFKDFCKFNTTFHKAIANDLLSHEYVNVEIKSMDGKEHLTFFDLLIAVKIFSQYYKHLPNIQKSHEARIRCLEALNKSCEMGLFNALLARCDLNTTKLLNTTVSNDKKWEAVESILNDTKRLSNLYWSMGYIQAGYILQEVAENLPAIQDRKDRAVITREESLIKFICASLLEKNPNSKKIEKGITGGKEYFEEEEVEMEMKDGDNSIRTRGGAKKAIYQLSGSHASYERLLDAAKEEIDSIIKSSEAESKLSP